ncbi:hypothetical protein [uncultured Comamonas sp.]|uniref:hypothetical protein n=1 Tax=uncultured Comamonas sp. TaxID=114710 RepID=UPI002592BA55|nr:hypothetical protein [uncultured Comamonas sp.]
MTHMTDQERAEPIKMQPGDDLHLTMLMAPHGLNFVTGKDREQLLAWGRDVWQAARRTQVVPMTLEQAQQSMRSATSHKPGKIIAASGLCAPQPPEANSAEFDRIKAAPVQMPEPAAWVYSFTHSSATGKPDLRVDSITTDHERAFSEGHSDQFALYTEHQVRSLLAAQQFTLDELAMLTRKLVQQLRKASPGNESAEKALDYLKRKGLAGNPLRTTQELST